MGHGGSGCGGGDVSNGSENGGISGWGISRLNNSGGIVVELVVGCVVMLFC